MAGLFSAALAVMCTFNGVHTFGPHSDVITNLPGAPAALPFKQYSGYATVDEENGRTLFYWFVESQSSPSKDPLVLWLNGGPGCSSLGGMTAENGPFWPDKNGALVMNDYSWNKVANVIYLESPSGVGFSYSNTSSDYSHPGDSKSANDVVQFLGLFFKAYPQYKGRNFYVTGESYGGHYVPTTAQAIIKQNSDTDGDVIALKGVMVGNAWTLPGDDNLGIVQTWLGYNLIRKETGDDVMKYCNLSNMLPILESSSFPSALMATSEGAQQSVADEKMCSVALDKASTETGNVDPYDIYQLSCNEGHSFGRRAALLSKMAQSDAPLRMHAANALRAMQSAGPCQMEYSQAYLNMRAVQEAIHARPTTWSECNMQINSNYSRVDFLASMLPVHEFLLRSGVRVLVYSGDVDAVVPTHGSRNWIAKLAASGAIRESESWTPWTDSASQVGGYITRYGSQFTFITVHGAGHMVPSTQPRRSLDILTKYLEDKI